jgi:NTE family protein
MSRLEGAFTLPAVSPYLYPPFAEMQFRRLLERHISTEAIRQVKTGPLLLIGAVDVLSGEFKVFSSERSEISLDAVLASAAVPNLFRAVRIDRHLYWDGLFSQNPPVRDLPDAQPDEIWIVQINPSTRAKEPRLISDILDRRNELSGNLSLSQELFFINKINELVASGALTGKYREISVGKIVMDRDLDYASKLDRSPGFIADLIAHGEEAATAFLASRVPAS